MTISQEYLLHTDDGSLILYSPEYGEGYRSIEGAFTESKLLFLEASGFSQRIREEIPKNIHNEVFVLDIGLGLGYNALSAISDWLNEETKSNLTLISIEKNPTLVQHLCNGDAIWQQTWPKKWLEIVHYLQKSTKYPDFYNAKINHPNENKSITIQWIILVADALETKTTLQKFEATKNIKFDFIFQDPFSPKKNSELWSIEFFNQLSELCKSDGKLTTYSVARQVRENFMAANWFVEKIQGTIGKKNWLRCYKTKPDPTLIKTLP